MKRLSFITQFKIEFLLPFTGCKKLLGKMPDEVTKATVCFVRQKYVKHPKSTQKSSRYSCRWC